MRVRWATHGEAKPFRSVRALCALAIGTSAAAIAVNTSTATPAYATGSSLQYTEEFLGGLGGAFSFSVAINDSGQVAGYGTTGTGQTNAFLWSPSAGMTDLGILPGDYSSLATALNAAGEVVGDSQVVQNGRIVGLACWAWTAASGMVSIDDFGDPTCYPVGVNSSGEVAGYIANQAGTYSAFVWTPTTGTSVIGTLGGQNSIAAGINDAGEVVGRSQTAQGAYHAFSWTAAAGIVDLGTLGGQTSSATAINGAGQIAGYAATVGGDNDPAAWLGTTAAIDLGTLGGTTGTPAAISDSGEIVGSSADSNNNQRAFAWTPAGGLVNLGYEGGSGRTTTSEANAVNDSGAVVGANVWSTGFEGFNNAFVWTPSTGMTLLPANYGYGKAVAVNDSGVIAGDDLVSAVIWVAPTAQTISFTSANPSPVRYGDSYTPTATATSGLPVSFSIDAASTSGCTITGGVVSFTGSPGVGTCIVDADQPGNASYGAAPEVQQVITVLADDTAGGSFVIGDLSAGGPTVGETVQFWGAQWAKTNQLSGGAPSSFEGFEDAAPAFCGSDWSTAPGDSAQPPANVPPETYMIVAGTITKSGSVISGDALHVVVVKTDPGYGPDPGHAGTGTIEAVVC